MKIIKFIKKIIKLYILRKKINIDYNKKNCFIMLACDYGNLGDIAITAAQKKFLQTTLKDYNIIEVPISKIFPFAISIRKSLKKCDIITIIGGGNSGDRYLDFEEKRRFISSFFSYRCKIISFPQTVEWSNTSKGKKEEKISKKIYEKSNIVFVAREENSYSYYKNNYRNSSYLTPDIVLSLDLTNKNIKRDSNLLLCLRNDSEIYRKKEVEKFINFIKENYKNIIYKDTKLDDNLVNLDNKEKHLKNILNSFSKSNIIITNRLHGMIFAVITGSKCISIDNSNHKIRNTYYTWLSNYKNIYFIDDLSDIDYKKIKEFIDSKYENFDNNKLKDKFQNLKEILKTNDGDKSE